MTKQVQINSDIDINELLKQSEALIKKSEVTSARVKENIKKNKKKSREIERRISLLL